MASLGPFGETSHGSRPGRRRPSPPGPGRGRRALALSALVLVVPLGAAGCVGDVPEAPVDDPELQLGQVIYTNNCLQCHGPDGGGGVGPRLSGGALIDSVPDPAEQRDLVVNGRGRMPSFSDKLNDEEIDAVVRYTREIIAER